MNTCPCGYTFHEGITNCRKCGKKMGDDLCPRCDGPGASPCSPSVEEFLAKENQQLRKAGCKLAEAALHVAREYDGVHRLMLSVSEWATAVADEGGRGKANSQAGASQRDCV